ncbi:MAG: hypothetical protein CMJ12_00585 [Pelagibacterales bacterium]|nr:hypothetical protein [Pelagibacterales bacterium]
MIKYIINMVFIIFAFTIFFGKSTFAKEEINICNKKNIKISSVSDDLKLCISSEGITIQHFNNYHSYNFVNHLESQFYLIKSLPSGFLCRDGIFISKSLPVYKYKPINGIYLYKLDKGKNNLEPVIPPVPAKFKIRDYLMIYDEQERRKKIGLALVVYNGNKDISKGSITILKKSDESNMKFELSKCRLNMTDLAKKINRYTMKRIR